jgi:hypothetical protein
MPITNLPNVVIVILNWNGWEDTLVCLDSLKKITYAQYYIILIDNGSSDNSVEILTKYQDSHLLFIPLKDNLGFAKGCNYGMQYALKELDPDYILLLNNDTSVEPDFLIKIVEAAEKTGAGMTQPLILRMGDHQIIDTTGNYVSWGLAVARGSNQINRNQYQDSKGLIGVSGACALYKVCMIRHVGMLDESFKHGHEDTEYGWRAVRAGWKSLLVPSAVIYHKGEVSGKKLIQSDSTVLTKIFMDSARPCKMYGTRIQKIQFIIRMLYFGCFSQVRKFLGRSNIGFTVYGVAIKEMIS